MQQIEILAPAGSVQAMKAAFQAGADAVYIGGDLFGARAYADNPDQKALLEAIDYAHLHGKKLYLTVNTLLKNHEISDQLAAYLDPFYAQGLDAAIIQDQGVFEWVHNRYPELMLHCSTQMTVATPEYACYMRDLGATRIVPPRELSVSELAAIKKACGLEMEVFVHGALCYCYSGQCLMSSMIGGRSGNRGRCAQPCRLPYSFDESHKTAYLLSPKDICGLRTLPDLIEAGTDSLKIEGRMKKPEYAALTASLYKHYVDLYMEKSQMGYAVEEADLKKLMDIYNRGGFTEGYFHMHNGKEMMTFNRPNHSGTVAGSIVKNKNGSMAVRFDEDLGAGDVIELPDGSQIKLEQAQRAGSMKKIPASKNLQNGKKVLRTRNAGLIDDLEKRYVNVPDLKEKIYGFVTMKSGQQAAMQIVSGETTISIVGDVVQKAVNRPMSEAEVRKRLVKTGNTPFEFERLDIEIDPDCFMPIQSLNALRRQALDAYEEMFLARFRRDVSVKHKKTENRSGFDSVGNDEGYEDSSSARGTGLSVLAETMDQLKSALNSESVKRIYMESFLDTDYLKKCRRLCHDYGKAFYLAMPHIFRNTMESHPSLSEKTLKTISPDGFLVRNPDSVFYLNKIGQNKPVIADYTMYSMNDGAAKQWLRLAGQITLPVELNRKELLSLTSRTGSEMIAYGHIPLMISAQCLVKNTAGCHKEMSFHTLVDRKHHGMPVRNVCPYCYNLIYNSVPHHLGKYIAEDLGRLRCSSMRLQFTREDGETAAEIIKYYDQVCLQGKAAADPVGESTRGHYQRGVL